jgi:hypothetical protein
LTRRRDRGPCAVMANLLSDAKKQQVIALGQLGWTLRRIEAATGVRRETAGAYLKTAGLAVRPAGRWGHPPKPAKGCPPTPSRRRGLRPPRRGRPGLSERGRQCVRALPRISRTRRRGVATRWRSSAISSTTTASPASTPACAASCAVGPGRDRPKRTRSSSRRPARKARSITATAQWCVIPVSTVTQFSPGAVIENSPPG